MVGGNARTWPGAQVVVLYVEQEESVRRQLNRAQLAAKHNTRVLDAGAGDLWELRPTDIDDAKCRRRYDVFKVPSVTRAAHLGQVVPPKDPSWPKAQPSHHFWKCLWR